MFMFQKIIFLQFNKKFSNRIDFYYDLCRRFPFGNFLILNNIQIIYDFRFFPNDSFRWFCNNSSLSCWRNGIIQIMEEFSTNSRRILSFSYFSYTKAIPILCLSIEMKFIFLIKFSDELFQCIKSERILNTTTIKKCF